MSEITVSVFILTYNQEQFIRQTIESILMQKTDFNFQLVIGEDFSKDKTRTICEEFAKKNSQKIKLLPSLDKNIGLIANYMRTINECDGKYIAICDGDDYWIDEFKLQKQVDILESNPDYSIVYTKVKRLFPNGEIKESIIKNRKQAANFADLVHDNFIPSVSVLFRNKQNVMKLPDWIISFPYGDWPTYLWTIKDSGSIFFLDQTTAVYRMSIGESFKIRKVNSDIVKVNLGILNKMLSDSSFKKHFKIITEVIKEKEINLMSSFNREKKYLKGFWLFLQNILKNSRKVKVIKMYFYSIRKSF
jgi:glycosyltransferase involved in cell wall biosynthesis